MRDTITCHRIPSCLSYGVHSSPVCCHPIRHFHERAAILEHDEGLGRAEALQGCFVLWSGRRCWQGGRRP